jgi:surface protein
MTAMFSYCSKLRELNVTSFNTEKVTIMYDMFSQTDSLTSLDLSSFKTPALTNILEMFFIDPNSSVLRTLDMSNFDFSNVTSFNDIFTNRTNLVVTVKDAAAKTFCESLPSLPGSISFVVKQ